MAQFIAFELVPILATFWAVVGSLGLTWIIGLAICELILRSSVQTKGTTDHGRSGTTLAMLGSAYLIFVALGVILLRLTKQATRDPQPILLVVGSLCLLGGLLATFYLWRGLRRRA